VTPTKDTVGTAVREILETDLKFAGMDLPDDLAMVGDGLMLDSLDVLMLITAIEKRFGHKIPKGKLGAKSMPNIGGFIEFVYLELQSASSGS
jgi:acyl carrier protein